MELMEEYLSMREIGKERGVTSESELDSFAVTTMRLRRGLDTRFENDGVYPLIENGKLLRKPVADQNITTGGST